MSTPATPRVLALLLVTLFASSWTTSAFVGAQKFDLSLPITSVSSLAGNNVTIACPSMVPGAMVRSLKWKCQGCMSDDRVVASPTREVELVDYKGEKATILFGRHHGRVDLMPSKNYALFFHPVSTGDTGIYMCSLNGRPPDSLVQLLVQDVPVPPGRPMVVKFDSRSVVLSWSPSEKTHNSPITHYIVYRRVGDSGVWDDLDGGIRTPDNKTHLEITGLAPYTVYSFRLAAVNALGRSSPSQPSYPIFTLREVPSGKPTITQAHNESATSIVLQWVPPPSETLHGEFTGYEITYRARAEPELEARRVTISERSYRDYVIKDLKPFTQYVVSLAVRNPAGIGPASTVVVMTDEGVPSAPRNLSVLKMTDRTAELAWSMPIEPNGVITGFRVYFVDVDNFTDYRTVPHNKGDPQRTSFHLKGIKPFTEYDVWVKSFTWKHEGEPSEHVHFTTDVGGPGPPVIVNVTCQPPASLMMHWQKPDTLHGGLDFYYIYYRDREVSWDFAEEVPVGTNPEKNVQSMLLTNLTDGVVYEVRVRGAAMSLFNREKIHLGNWSNTGYTLVTEDCKSAWQLMATQLPSLHDSRANAGISDLEYHLRRVLDMDPALLAGIGCGAGAVLLISLAFFLWRRTVKTHTNRRSENKNGRLPLGIVSGGKNGPGSNGPGFTGSSLDGENGQSQQLLASDSKLMLPGSTPSTRRNNNGSLDSGSLLGSSAILSTKFAEHIAALHADADAGFVKEFQDLQAFSAEIDHTSDLAHHPENKEKNRYQNVVAYDHSMVPLMKGPMGSSTNTIGSSSTATTASIGGEYINANLIDGWKKPNAFIATQGPLQSTVPAFWRMIYEHNVKTIVMITNLVERGKTKCEQYWPDEGVETYGGIQVKAVSQVTRASYTLRTFLIRKTKTVTFGDAGLNGPSPAPSPCPEIEIKQWHFTAWPDHGTPPLPVALLQFVRSSVVTNPPNSGPILVHCSAGVGRTGAYIVIAAMLAQLEAEGKLDVFHYLRHIRNQRNYMVQTVEQYVFIHEALLVACEMGDTEISLPCLQPRLKQLLSSNKDNLLKQWKFLNGPGWPRGDVSMAMNDCNRHKNRDLEFLPPETCRVPLTPRMAANANDRDQCDYINASWTTGFYNTREFVITQHPMEKTIGDFWRLVWEQNCQTIVLFSAPDYQFYPCFWPEAPQDSLHIEGLKITLEEEHTLCGLPELHIRMRPDRAAVASGAIQPDQMFAVTLLLAPGWPHAMSPQPLALAHEVVKSHAVRCGRDAPILVVDKLGGVEAATFCTLTALMSQFSEDKKGDIFQMASLVQKSRPNCWRRQEDFNFLYRAVRGMEEYCANSNSTYGRLKRNSWSSNPAAMMTSPPMTSVHLAPNLGAAKMLITPAGTAGGFGPSMAMTMPKFPKAIPSAPAMSMNSVMSAQPYGTISRVPPVNYNHQGGMMGGYPMMRQQPGHQQQGSYDYGRVSPAVSGYSTLPSMPPQMDYYTQQKPDLLVAAPPYSTYSTASSSPSGISSVYYNASTLPHMSRTASPSMMMGNPTSNWPTTSSTSSFVNSGLPTSSSFSVQPVSSVEQKVSNNPVYGTLRGVNVKPFNGSVESTNSMGTIDSNQPGGVLRSLSEVSVVTVVENDGHRAPPEGMETIILSNLDGHAKRQNNFGIDVI